MAAFRLSEAAPTQEKRRVRGVSGGPRMRSPVDA